MRAHVLSDPSGAVLALEMSVTRPNGDHSRFALRTQQTSHHVEVPADLLGRLRTEGWPLLSRLRIVVEAGESRLVA